MTSAQEVREPVVRAASTRRRRLVPIAVAVLALAAIVITVTVITRPTTGSVTIQIAAGTPGGPFTAVVSTSGWSTTRHLAAGDGEQVDGVPYGWVTIEAKGLCTVASRLSASESHFSLSYSDKHCVLGN